MPRAQTGTLGSRLLVAGGGGGGGGGGGANPMGPFTGTGTGAGGGGPSFAVPGATATFATDTTGTPELVISYSAARASPSQLTFAGAQLSRYALRLVRGDHERRVAVRVVQAKR